MLTPRARYGFFAIILFISPVAITSHVAAQDVPFTNESSVVLEIDFGNGIQETFFGINGTSVLEVTQAAYGDNVTVEWYGNLAYVTSIGGVANDIEDGLYWQFWVNDELAPMAANLMAVEPGDKITWRRTSSNFVTPTQESIDTSLYGGVFVISVVGATFLGLLQVATMRRNRRQ